VKGFIGFRVILWSAVLLLGVVLAFRTTLPRLSLFGIGMGVGIVAVALDRWLMTL
jgi:hypothetical protein